MGRKAKITERHRKVAKALVRGVPATQAFVEAGYSEATARKGTASLKERIRALAQALHEETMNAAREFLSQQAPNLSKVEIEQVVEAALVRNTIEGEGKAKGSTYAAKILGSLRRVNLFEPDNTFSVFSLQVPAEWKDRYSLESKQATIGDADAPALPPAPEPTGESQQET